MVLSKGGIIWMSRTSLMLIGSVSFVHALDSIGDSGLIENTRPAQAVAEQITKEVY